MSPLLPTVPGGAGGPFPSSAHLFQPVSPFCALTVPYSPSSSPPCLSAPSPPPPLQISSIVEEYFTSGDVANVAQSLEELGAPASMSHYFVKRLVTLALDRKGREREMASVLLSGLYGEVSQGLMAGAGMWPTYYKQKQDWLSHHCAARGANSATTVAQMSARLLTVLYCRSSSTGCPLCTTANR